MRALLVAAALCGAVSVYGGGGSFEIYRDSFDAGLYHARPGVRARWFANGKPGRRATSIYGSRAHMAGPFASEEVDLLLTNLPAHEAVVVDFTFVLARCHDGESCGPDRLRLTRSDGVHWSDASEDDDDALVASGEDLSLGDLPARTDPGAYLARISGAENADAAYDIVRRFDHSASVLRLRWRMPISDDDEQWGIARLRISAVAASRSLDISGMSKRVRGRSAIMFCATAGVPSHAFVVFEDENAGARQSTVAAFGFYPDPEVSRTRIALLGSVSGLVLDDLRTGPFSRVDQRLIVYVNRRQTAAARAVVGMWKCRASYRLMSRDCVAFTQEIAAALGLSVPERGLFSSRPADYMRLLIEGN